MFKVYVFAHVSETYLGGINFYIVEKAKAKLFPSGYILLWTMFWAAFNLKITAQIFTSHSCPERGHYRQPSWLRGQRTLLEQLLTVRVLVVLGLLYIIQTHFYSKSLGGWDSLLDCRANKGHHQPSSDVLCVTICYCMGGDVCLYWNTQMFSCLLRSFPYCTFKYLLHWKNLDKISQQTKTVSNVW